MASNKKNVMFWETSVQAKESRRTPSSSPCKLRNKRFLSSLEQKFLVSAVISSLLIVIYIEHDQKLLYFRGQYFASTPVIVHSSNNSRVNASTTKVEKSKVDSFTYSSSCNYTVPSLYPWARSHNLPKYIKDYLNWHVDQTSSMTNAEQQKEKQAKYLVVQCLKEFPRCGGLSDRLRPLPVYIYAAIQMKRILLFQWTKPCQLEEFLTPPPCGINWTVPAWLHTPNLTHANIVNFGKVQDAHFIARTATENFLTIKIQWPPEDAYNKLISQFYNDTVFTYTKVYRHLFYSFFTLTQPIQSVVDQQMARLGLTAGSYTSIHVRARHPNSGFYAMGNRHVDKAIDKEGGFVLPQEEGRYKKKIHMTLQEAFSCAYSLHSNIDNTKKQVIYFASDSHHLNNYVVQQTGVKLNPAYSVVALNHSVEPLHLDVPDKTTRMPSDFYLAFVDLWILSHSKCILYGAGRFGIFASYISNNKSHDACRINYHTSTSC